MRRGAVTIVLATLLMAAPTRAEEPETSPRAWPIVLGSLIFVPTYGATVYWAVSGDATSYGPIDEGESDGRYDFGDPWLLFIPVLGPLFFSASFCSDAKETHAREEMPAFDTHEACDGSFWTLDAAVQAVGAALIGAGFAFPVTRESGFVVRPFTRAESRSVGLTVGAAF